MESCWRLLSYGALKSIAWERARWPLNKEPIFEFCFMSCSILRFLRSNLWLIGSRVYCLLHEERLSFHSSEISLAGSALWVLWLSISATSKEQNIGSQEELQVMHGRKVRSFKMTVCSRLNPYCIQTSKTSQLVFSFSRKTIYPSLCFPVPGIISSLSQQQNTWWWGHSTTDSCRIPGSVLAFV